jgi:hypothetical protein
MPERPDLRKIAADIREALASYPREALVDILTYVFQAYVVEGAPTVQAAQPERIDELEGLAFPELVQALQTRLDVPELGLFEVQNGRVLVRVGGELQVLALGNEGRRGAAAPLSAGPMPGAPLERPIGAPGATAIEPAPGGGAGASGATGSAGAGRAPAGTAAATMPGSASASGGAAGGAGAGGPVAREAPRPARGIAVNPGGGRPTATPQTAAPAAGPGGGGTAAPGARTPGAAPAPAEDPGDDDAASKRFRLLEID